MQSNNVRMEEDDTIDLLDLFRELVSHWVVILTSAVIVGVIALLISKFLMTPTYSSTANLYVLSKSTSVTSLADIQLGSNLANDYVKVVFSRPVLDQVISNLGINETYNSLKGKLTVNNPTNTRILEITIVDGNPDRAKLIVDEIADVSAAFISEKMDQTPPSVLQYGYSDAPKIGPSVKKNTIIGALAGAVFVMAILVVSYLINDTLTNPEDIEAKLGITLLGTLPLDKKEYNETPKKRKKKSKK